MRLLPPRPTPFPYTTLFRSRSIPRLSPVGLAPAATVFTPSRKIACASTGAVVVPSPATSEVLEATSDVAGDGTTTRSEEHTSELQSPVHPASRLPPGTKKKH